jgi:hypothetical protein
MRIERPRKRLIMYAYMLSDVSYESDLSRKMMENAFVIYTVSFAKHTAWFHHFLVHHAD